MKTNPQLSGSLSIISLLFGIWSHLSRRRRIQLFLLFIIMLISGLSELVSLGAVLPFLAALTEPELLLQDPFISNFTKNFGVTTSSQIILLASAAFSATTVVAALIRLINLWVNGRYAAAVGSELSCEAYYRTLHQPYEFHVQCNSAALINGTTTQVGLTVGALTAFLQISTAAVVCAGLLVGLLIIDPKVALIAFVLFGSAYGTLALTIKNRLRSNSKLIARSTTQQGKTLQEGLGGIRDVLLYGSQSAYLDTYKRADWNQRKLQAENGFLGSFPRYAIEALGVVAICVLGGTLMLRGDPEANVVPLIGSLALGAQRLLPALQQIYSGWSILKSYSSGIEAVLSMLNQRMPLTTSISEPFQLKKSICLENVTFAYGDNETKILKGIDMSINSGQCIGLVGHTGGGKSTLVDVIMGLLQPTTGRVLIDGLELHDLSRPERLLAWRAAIAHVPQNIFLSDNSFAENIAFGVPLGQINMPRVRKAAEQAQIAAYIEGLPLSYDTFVGERGIRLSGGQKQRIGIARALYRHAKVLILDEATSALDTRTESIVMDSIGSLSKHLTIVMVAHRLSTLEHCDKIFEISDGKILKVESSTSFLTIHGGQP